MKNHVTSVLQSLEARRVDRRERSRLENEIIGFDTPAQRQDFEATLDRYADQDTAEMRHFLAAQAVHA